MTSNNSNDHLKDLAEIRNLMERSSRFISLSGLSGICAGVFALLGAGLAFYEMNIHPFIRESYIARSGRGKILDITTDTSWLLIAIALVVLVASLAAGMFFTMRNAKKKGQTIWDSSSKRMIINLAIPLMAGGFFCLVLLHHQIYGLIAPATLIFYGLALVNAGKYTLSEISYLGVLQIIIGVISTLYIGYGLLFWAVGFGLLHIVYGAVMYYKYER